MPKPKHPQTVFGKRLRCAREQCALPQDRLGVLIGLDEGCASARISRYETGTHEPSYPIAQRLAAVLSVPTAYLYCEDDEMAQAILLLHGVSGPEMKRVLGNLVPDPEEKSATAA